MKWYKLLLYAILLVIAQSAFSQKQNDNWFFGKYVGINFNSLAPNGYNLVTGSQMEAPAGSAVMSDPITGQLLFYTDGRTIWNKNHAIMNNGSDLRGSPSSAQPAIIIPKPGSNTIYYVFTISGITDYLGLSERKGLSYSIVDMSLNSGLGGVTTKNVILFTNSDTEMLTSTLGHDGSYYWVVTQKESNFHAYKVSSMGISTTPVTSIAPYSAIGDSAKKGIKISPNSQHLAIIYYQSYQSKVFVYNFNNSTGIINNGEEIYYNFDSDYYLIKNALEFSPDSNVLYLAIYRQWLNHTAGSSIHRFSKNLTEWEYDYEHVFAIDFDDDDNGEYPESDNGIKSLQLSPNGKIFVSGTSGRYRNRNYLAYIDNPNSSSAYLSLPNNLSPSTHKIYKGFPQLIYSNSAPLCEQNIFITQPITSSQDFQVSNKIEASSIVYQNFNVNFRGSQIILKPGFSVSGYNSGIFRAIVDPCVASFNLSENKEEINADENITVLKEPVLFPNPTTTILNIDNIADINEWKLVDINGKTVESGKVNNSIQTKITINTSRLMPGVYYFNAVMKNGELFQKTVMKK